MDYEVGSLLSIQVQARDEFNATAEGNFTVSLTDVIEDLDRTGMELTPLGRKDGSDFGQFSNFASGFTLDGNRIAAWQEFGNGIVNVWDIAEGGTLTFLQLKYC